MENKKENIEKELSLSDLKKSMEKVRIMCEQELQEIEPVVRKAIDSGVRDLDYLDEITKPLYDIVVMIGAGRELYDEYVNYVETFNPQKAWEYREHDDEMHGVYDDVKKAACDMAEEYHIGQVDKAGVDYFEGHLVAVGFAGDNWKEKVVGLLHDAAEDTSRTVDEIVETLKQRAGGSIPNEKDTQEIREALNLLNSKTASSREEYIARIKKNTLATKVKLNDLRHNMDLSRIASPTELDVERTKRYSEEYSFLSEIKN
jgi:(p)ppGpp synthase/HD superfamily hydrolase